MTTNGLEITAQQLTPHLIEYSANGAPLVRARRQGEVWVLPYPPADTGELTCSTPDKATKHVEWDAHNLNQDRFGEAYPNHVPVTVRELDDTLYSVERAGIVLACVHQDVDTGRWHIVDRNREIRADRGFEYRDTAVEHVMDRVRFYAAIPQRPRGVA